MKNITCIEDLRQIHKRRVPKPFFDYVDGGSYAEETLRANISDMQKYKFRQRILVDISKRQLNTTILGETAAARWSSGPRRSNSSRCVHAIAPRGR